MLGNLGSDYYAAHLLLENTRNGSSDKMTRILKCFEISHSDMMQFNIIRIVLLFLVISCFVSAYAVLLSNRENRMLRLCFGFCVFFLLFIFCIFLFISNPSIDTSNAWPSDEWFHFMRVNREASSRNGKTKRLTEKEGKARRKKYVYKEREREEEK